MISNMAWYSVIFKFVIELRLGLWLFLVLEFSIRIRVTFNGRS